MLGGLIPNIGSFQNKQLSKKPDSLFSFTPMHKQSNEPTIIPYELYAIGKLLKYSLGDDVTVEEYIHREDNSSTFKIYKGLECIGLYNPSYEHKKLQLFNPEKYKEIFSRLVI